VKPATVPGSKDVTVVIGRDVSMSELGKQFGRAYGVAPKAVFRAALSKSVGSMLSEMMRADVPAPRAEGAIEEFRKAAVSEWKRIVIAVRSSPPGRA
jgi:hypothetical protein